MFPEKGEDNSFLYKLKPEHGDLIANSLDSYLDQHRGKLPQRVIDDAEIIIAQMDFLSKAHFFEDSDEYDHPDYDPNEWYYQDDPEAEREYHENVEVVEVVSTENVVCIQTARAAKEATSVG